MNPFPDDDPLITKRQLADLLGWTERTIDNWRVKFGLPCLKVGRTVMFSYRQVRRHLEKIGQRHQVKPPPRPAPRGRRESGASR